MRIAFVNRRLRLGSDEDEAGDDANEVSSRTPFARSRRLSKVAFDMFRESTTSFFGNPHRPELAHPTPDDFFLPNREAFGYDREGSTSSISIGRSDNEVRILFLGCGDSGKTTFQKQLRRLYNSPLSEQERRSAACVIIHNLIWGIEAVLNSFSRFGRTLPDHIIELMKAMKQGSGIDFQQSTLNAKLHEHLVGIATNATFREVLAEIRASNALDLHECFYEFLNKLVSQPGWGLCHWIPTDDEIISQYIRTSGIIRQQLTIDEERNYVLLDTGGQRCERRKWQHAFNEAHVVMFMASLAEYDQVLYEDPNQNRLEESMQLFQELLAMPKLEKCDFYLVLTKRDEFETKLVRSRIPLNISGRFPDAPTAHDTGVALEWIEKRFRIGSKRHVTIKHISALDQEEVRDVFETVCCSTNVL